MSREALWISTGLLLSSSSILCTSIDASWVVSIVDTEHAEVGGSSCSLSKSKELDDHGISSRFGTGGDEVFLEVDVFAVFEIFLAFRTKSGVIVLLFDGITSVTGGDDTGSV
jgi:hypothetical protein